MSVLSRFGLDLINLTSDFQPWVPISYLGLTSRTSSMIVLRDSQALVFTEVPCESNVQLWLRTGALRLVVLYIFLGQQQHQHHLLEMQILGLTPDVMNQSWSGPAVCFNKSSG